MDLITRDEIQKLTGVEGRALISLYMPTHKAGAEIQQDGIRLKNLLDQAESELSRAGFGPAEVRSRLEPLRLLVDDAEFWKQNQEGLALFRSEDDLHIFRLPEDVLELAYVNSRFYTKPLIPMLAGDESFYILALSLNKVRLLEASRYAVKEIPLQGVADNMEEALGYDDVQNQLQFHNKTSGRSGDRSTVYMGQGGSDEEDKKDDILRFFQMINKSIYGKIGKTSKPLVLAGVEYLLPIYREANSYTHIFSEGITGNPEESSSSDLHEQAWNLIAPHFAANVNTVIDSYHILQKEGQATKDIEQIVPASFFGQVDTLMVSPANQIWGKYDPSTFAVSLTQPNQPEAEDLTDIAVANTLKNGGTVIALDLADMPDGAVIAANLRYPLKGYDYKNTIKF